MRGRRPERLKLCAASPRYDAVVGLEASAYAAARLLTPSRPCRSANVSMKAESVVAAPGCQHVTKMRSAAPWACHETGVQVEAWGSSRVVIAAVPPRVA